MICSIWVYSQIWVITRLCCWGETPDRFVGVGAGGARAVAAVAEAARPLGMSVNLANWRGTRIEQIEDLRYLVEAARAGNVRVLLDAAQFHASAVNPLDVVAEFGDLVGCVHLGDCIGHRPVPVGQGEVNLGGVLRQARHAGYDGWFVIDFEVSGREDPLEGLAEALSHVQSLA